MCQHLDLRIPDDLKLDLHQDFWRHRRGCARCDGNHTEASWAWSNTVCPLEHLVKKRYPRVLRRGESDPDESKPRKVASGPPKRGKKTEKTAEEIRAENLAKGKVEVWYQIDDDFDAAGVLGEPRAIWVKDRSAAKYDIVEEVEVMVEELEVCIKMI